MEMSLCMKNRCNKNGLFCNTPFGADCTSCPLCGGSDSSLHRNYNVETIYYDIEMMYKDTCYDMHY
jgi:hypothetical protein